MPVVSLRFKIMTTTLKSMRRRWLFRTALFALLLPLLLLQVLVQLLQMLLHRCCCTGAAAAAVVVGGGGGGEGGGRGGRRGRRDSAADGGGDGGGGGGGGTGSFKWWSNYGWCCEGFACLLVRLSLTAARIRSMLMIKMTVGICCCC